MITNEIFQPWSIEIHKPQDSRGETSHAADLMGDNLFPQFDLAEMLFGNAYAFPGRWTVG